MQQSKPQIDFRVTAVLAAFVILPWMVGCAQDSTMHAATKAKASSDATATGTATTTTTATATATPTPTATPDPRGAIIPGSITFSTAGSFTFIVPSYNTIHVKVWGGGGGGGASGDNSPGGTGGGTSTFGAITAYGGSGGYGGYNNDGTGGQGGSSSGGDYNNVGSPGSNAWDFNGGAGANDPSGATSVGAKGGESGFNTGDNGASAIVPGGGGGGGGGSYFWHDGAGGGGGAGGYGARDYQYPELPLSDVMNVIVGAGGIPGKDFSRGGYGHAGQVTISWE